MPSAVPVQFSYYDRSGKKTVNIPRGYTAAAAAVDGRGGAVRARISDGNNNRQIP